MKRPLTFLLAMTFLTVLTQAGGILADGWQKNCSSCHGIYGDGDGVLADILELKNTNLKGKADLEQKAAAIKAKNELVLTDKVNHFTKKLGAAEIQEISAFIKKFKKIAPGKSVPLTSNLYKNACINCHGKLANGVPEFEGLIGKAKDFRSHAMQNLNFNELKAVIEKSASKKIRLARLVKHFPNSMTAADYNQILKKLKSF
ncbi:MAG: c-type cytochrome [Leptospiraceae bacterium]|nr:c-type cytochrome [Leptospiraceae bacterium]